MRTQVAIIGAGPTGLMLGRLLDLAGIDNAIVERRSREHVLSRIRAGILEQTTVDLLRRAETAQRLDREGIAHEAVNLAFDGAWHRLGLPELTGGKCVTAYGQTELTRDLQDARERDGGPIFYAVEDVALHDFNRRAPYVTYAREGSKQRIDCELIAGCDGFHGVSRASVPDSAIETFAKVYPCAWLGVLSDTPPVSGEVVYANNERGFALCSMRSRSRSRYYIQCPVDDAVTQWSDDAFWDELRRRLPADLAERLVTGPSIDKSIAALRSFVTEPMHFGRLVLAGDAAHIVPPTGAKGLNLAASDIHYLSEAIPGFLLDGDDAALTEYSRRALDRVWKSERFSWWFTLLTHRFDGDPFEQRMKVAELNYLIDSETGRRMVAENYVGLPL